MVILVMVASTVLNALGLGLMTMTSTETLIAANYREASEVLYAADAAAECAIADVRRAASVAQLLSGVATSSFREANLAPVLASGARVDLVGLTATLQASSDAETKLGANNPQWRLFLNGSLSRIVNSPEASAYVAAWVADDPSDGDGDAGRDSNGVLTVRATAFGRFGTQRTVEVTIAKTRGTSILSWRELR